MSLLSSVTSSIGRATTTTSSSPTSPTSTPHLGQAKTDAASSGSLLPGQANTDTASSGSTHTLGLRSGGGGGTIQPGTSTDFGLKKTGTGTSDPFSALDQRISHLRQDPAASQPSDGFQSSFGDLFRSTGSSLPSFPEKGSGGTITTSKIPGSDAWSAPITTTATPGADPARGQLLADEKQRDKGVGHYLDNRGGGGMSGGILD